MKIGMLGLGTVGTGVFRILTEAEETLREKTDVKLELKKILVRSPERERWVKVPRELLTTGIDEILEDPEIEMIVEVMGGEEPARRYIADALQSGKAVVTSNKEVMAKHGEELSRIAREKGVDLFFEGSVAGGIPVLRSLTDSLAGEDIKEVFGIVNGTTNYILSAMASEGRDFEEVLQEAQAKGFAEADPTADIAGYDAARKAAILAALAYGVSVPLEDIYCEGIENIDRKDVVRAAEMGMTVKLLAQIRKIKDGIDVRVHPALVSNDNPLAGVDGVNNGVVVRGWAVGELMYYGPGAGQLPTGSAVVGDMVATAKNIVRGEASKQFGFQKKTKVVPLGETENAYYLRLRADEMTGAAKAVTSALEEIGAEINLLEQKYVEGKGLSLLILTGRVQEQKIQQVLRDLKHSGVGLEIEALLRILPA